MRYDVVIEAPAVEEIGAAVTYVRDQSPLNAQRWLAGLWEAIAGLETFPERFALAREDPHFPIELRQLVYHSHRLIFTIRGHSVHILHVRHAAMQWLDPTDVT